MPKRKTEMTGPKRRTEVATKESTGGQPRFRMDFKNATQRIAWGTFQQHDILFLIGPAGTGKTFLAMAFAIHEILQRQKKQIVLTRPIVEAGESLGYLPGPQPLDAKILTPDGWTTMGQLKIGDIIIGRDGKATKVLKIYPKGKKLVYKIRTTDGRTTECCEDHLWYTKTLRDRKHNHNGSVKSTKEISYSLRNKNDKINHFIPRNDPVEFKQQTLPIAPYTLGAMLGDGSMTNACCITGQDMEVIERVRNELAYIGCAITRPAHGMVYSIRSTARVSKTPRKIRLTNMATDEVVEYDSIGLAVAVLPEIKLATLKYRCKNQCEIDKTKYEFLPLENRWSNPIKKILEELGLLGMKSHNKFIPDIYKYSSIQDRLDLLRGLMDTDGTVKNRGEASFTTVSKNLAEDVIELVRSLGGSAKLRLRKKRTSSHCIQGRKVCPNYGSYEFNISLPNVMNPFYISRKAKKFRCKYMHAVGIDSIIPVCEKEVQCILVENNEHLYLTDDYIVTHNTFDEKVNPYMMPLLDSMKKLIGTQGPQHDLVASSVEIAPLAYMRGRSFSHSICIFDEAQNATYNQLKLFLTRIDDNSKIIITGDPGQTDLGEGSGLLDVLHRVDGIPGIGVVKFDKDSIVRHPLVALILEKLDS